MSQTKKHDHTVVIIGTGFGGTMTAIPLATEFTKRQKGEDILMLERGTWWTTPVSTVQDKEIKTAEFLAKKEQPVQYWSSQNHFRGFLDIFSRCYRRTKERRCHGHSRQRCRWWFTRLLKHHDSTARLRPHRRSLARVVDQTGTRRLFQPRTTRDQL
jgi:cation diffusion facilitator CzcD-associated flavoprotein CzcO